MFAYEYYIKHILTDLLKGVIIELQQVLNCNEYAVKCFINHRTISQAVIYRLLSRETLVHFFSSNRVTSREQSDTGAVFLWCFRFPQWIMIPTMIYNHLSPPLRCERQTRSSRKVTRNGWLVGSSPLNRYLSGPRTGTFNSVLVLSMTLAIGHRNVVSAFRPLTLSIKL
jgi:hypothetical protein